jgi:hypothetical protein
MAEYLQLWLSLCPLAQIVNRINPMYYFMKIIRSVFAQRFGDCRFDVGVLVPADLMGFLQCRLLLGVSVNTVLIRLRRFRIFLYYVTPVDNQLREVVVNNFVTRVIYILIIDYFC